MLLKDYIDPTRFNEFIASTGQDNDELQQDLAAIGYLALMADPAGFSEPLRRAVAALQKHLVSQNARVKECDWVHSEKVTQLFEDCIADATNATFGENLVAVPIIGGDAHIEKVAGLRDKVCRALAAQARFELEKPAGAPELPLREDRFYRMQRPTEAPLVRIIGHYAESMRGVGWAAHPTFHEYCCGLAAFPSKAELVRQAGLNVDPQPLQGLCSRGLWFTPEEEAQRRERSEAAAPAPKAAAPPKEEAASDVVPPPPPSPPSRMH
jgi:hypothetical protein